MLFHKYLSRLMLGLFLVIGGIARPSSGAEIAAKDSNTATAAPPPLMGPTLHLDYGQSSSKGNSVRDFMYFVPLIALEDVSVSQSPGNTQRVRVVSATRHAASRSFVTTCEFEFTGSGVQQNVLDHTQKILRHEQDLKKGDCLDHQLSSINVEGEGSGCVEVDGIITNHISIVTEVRLRFNYHGRPSPVTITLQDIRWRHGRIEFTNEVVAHVDTLSFRREAGTPKMNVTVASVKPKGAGNNLWQNVMGSLRGAAANLMIKPITIEPAGHKAMLDFGQALASKAASFTFPAADHLKAGTSKGG